MEQIEVIDPRDTSICNTYNNFEYAPYYFLNTISGLEIMVYKDWYDSLLDITKERIEMIIMKHELKFRFGKFSIPNDYYENLDIDTRKIFYEFYYAYNAQFDYDVYSKIMDNKYFLNDYESFDIDDNDKKYFISKYGISYQDVYYDIDCHNSLNEKINNMFDRYPNKKLFVRTLKTSGKNDELYPITNKFSLHHKLCNSYEMKREFIRRQLPFNNPSKLLFTEWKDLDDELEFRLIIQDHKLCGISQQKWKRRLSWKNNLIKMENIYKTIVEYFNQFSKELIYKDCVIDLQLFDISIMNVKYKYECKIIEINSGLSAFSSGSNLFNWTLDKYIFDSEEPIMRILG